MPLAAALGAMGVKVGVKGFRATGAGVDLAIPDQCVAVAVTADMDRTLTDDALGHWEKRPPGPHTINGPGGATQGATQR